MPLNIDWQQILLHWMNLAILTGALYFLLYKPVVNFMHKREQHYKDLEEKAQSELKKAQEARAQYEAKLDGAEDEIREARQKSHAAVQKSAEEQIALAQAQAREIVVEAHAKAKEAREKALRDSQRELKRIASEAAEKLAFHKGDDPFDSFLDLAEGGNKHDESR